jgi:sterol desaturase/sphingolipid hydroxylase (fatty acid hydroxylase superfamily)
MPNLIELAIPGFILLMTVEAIADLVMRRDLYEIKDAAASITMGLGNVAVNLVAKAMQLAIFGAIYRFRIFALGYQWWVWVLLFFSDEFSYYWFHRTSHECRLFWASHVVHHSSQRYNLSTALRQSWTGTFISWIFWAWLPLIGFRPMMVLTMQAISLLYQFWIHTELIRGLGPLERIFNTPSHHRVHHGANPRYIDRNHGGTLIVWDRLFGTFEPEKETPRFGLTKNIRTYNPVRIAFHEWADISRDVRGTALRRDKLRYIFGRPGWRPGMADGQDPRVAPPGNGVNAANPLTGF